MAIHRHDLVFVSPAAWRSLLETREDLAGEPVARSWVDHGRPLVARRLAPGESGELPLGLPLPPSAGKRRFSILMKLEDVVSIEPPLRISAAIDGAPESWKQTMQRVAALATAHGVEARIFGSLAWETLTGLPYLTATSDLDILLPLPPGKDIVSLAAALATIEETAPMRVDGELVRQDGSGLHWRELAAGAPELLIKSTHGVDLLPAHLLVESGGRS